jgi:hypothetical protein
MFRAAGDTSEWAKVDQEAARRLHEQLLRTEICELLTLHPEPAQLRRLLQATISTACIVERRYEGRRCTWARAEVEWTPEVQLLLEAGWLWPAAEPEPPTPRTAREKAAERSRRYRARKRDQAKRST